MAPDRPAKTPLHPRNRHGGRYDFDLLCRACPALTPYVAPNAWGDRSIDFADPDAVKTLNAALLVAFHGITTWELPPGALCPPIPGRSDAIHHVADLLASDRDGVAPRGDAVRVLDLGVGASCIYPILGRSDYGWSFVGSDIDPVSIAASRRIVDGNASLRGGVDLRLQADPAKILSGVVLPDERFDVTICNPPFHASLADAQQGSDRKWKQLGRAAARRTRNFGGQGAELWCPGGERGFVQRLVRESALFQAQFCWFTTLVSKQENVRPIVSALIQARVVEHRVIEMAQGHKRSRLVAWTSLDAARRSQWASRRAIS